jgi:hypothetical protein
VKAGGPYAVEGGECVIAETESLSVL